MMKKVIIDAGHGINTKGKSSPDCALMEWRYNREIANAIASQSAYICSETLAVELKAAEGGEWQEVEMNGMTASFRLTRV